MRGPAPPLHPLQADGLGGVRPRDQIGGSPSACPARSTTGGALRAQIHEDICRKAFDPDKNSFVQYYGSKGVDAALLLIPQVGFLPPEDARVQGTIAAIERELMEGGLVLRYRTEENVDGLPPGEGAFLACSFWLADVYEMLGRHDDAERLFEHLLSLRNDLGLLAEEYDPRTRRQLGNFPQGFSHVALVNTANNLISRRGPAEQRAERAGGA